MPGRRRNPVGRPLIRFVGDPFANVVAARFHADGVERQIRNDIYRGRSAEQYYDRLDWLFTAPDYVRDFRKAA